MSNINNATEDKQSIRLPRKLAFSVPLQSVLNGRFDYAAFTQAITDEDRLTAAQKRHVLETFKPDARVTMETSSPVSGIATHLEAGASRAMQSPDKMGKHSWKDENKTPLPADHPISKMWKDVWQKTLEHYAAEATEYEQIMAAKGHSLLDDPTLFPVKAPPIHLMPDMHIINAAAGIAPDGTPQAMVTAGFLSELGPEQQRAILFHEALHAFEPVLEGKTPQSRMIGHALTSLATFNHTSRQGEFRADEHAARTGHGDAMEAAFNQMRASDRKDFLHNATVLRHLAECGFSISVDGVKNSVAAAAFAYEKAVHHAIGGGNAATVQQFAETDVELDIQPQEFIGHIRDGLDQVGKKIRTAKDNIAASLLQKQVDDLNYKIMDGVAIDHAALQGTLVFGGGGKSDPPANLRERVGEQVGKLGERVKEAKLTHPKTTDRIEQIKRVKPCKGCIDSSPFTSHGDRVKAISKTGIQGIGPAR